MPKTKKSIGLMGGKVLAPSNHHNFEKVDKDAKAKDSTHVIMELENLPQPCKGFSAEKVSCKCLSDFLQAHSLHVDDMKIYFSNLSNEMWSEHGIGLDFSRQLLNFCAHSVLKVQ